ncbi:putative polysaccharide biosynthesis protein [Tuberibacillus sp. Marseille-P3662]|uniref:putative polysaccharide biosynthesis protein n=1 Tax=Tuberibacillus sp. Marseille-P3662 TaxID=1965358 RepID=UPI001593BFFA|nr:polysaccharide biosynthesis protein [Tuberibacillus sp. Marseille-P3662]
MAGSKILKGTMLLSAGMFLSKFLGMLFVVPLHALVGDVGGSIYTHAYNPYAIILSISTVGLPLAVSKYVSKYNALGDYQTSQRLFRSGLVVMLVTGLVGCLFMNVFAPWLAGGSGDYTSDVIFVIRVVSVAILIAPVMSLIRGFFQGFESMGPTALSQVAEQLGRIVFGLTAATVALYIFGASRTMAVALVAFGAFVGAGVSLAILISYWQKRKPYLDELYANSQPQANVSLKHMYKELISYAIPFVCVGLATMLYIQVDLFTASHFMQVFHDLKDLDSYVSNLTLYDRQIVMIPVSLATALALSVVPSVTSSYSVGDRLQLTQKITQAFQMILFLVIPAAVGISMLSYQIYFLLYGGEHLNIGGEVLRWYAPSAFLFAGFSVTAAILQGIDKQKVTIFSLLFGLLFKLSLNPLFINWFGMQGPILATDVGYLLSIGINLLAVRGRAGYAFNFVAKRFLLVGIFTTMMAIVVGVVVWISDRPETWLGALVTSIIAIILGGGFYMWLAFRSGLARQVLGKNIPIVGRFMK